MAAAQGAQVIIGGRDRQRLDEALKTLPQNAIARQVDAFSSTSLAAFFEDLPVVDMLFTPGTNYTVTPSPRRPRNRRAARSRASSGRSTGPCAALPRLAPDASVLLMSGAASARPSRAAPPAPPMRPSRAWPGAGHELAPRRVNAIAPGTIDSDLWQARPAELREAAFAQYRASTLLQAVGQVDDVANAAWMLLSNRYTTGTTFFVDGGYVLR